MKDYLCQAFEYNYDAIKYNDIDEIDDFDRDITDYEKKRRRIARFGEKRIFKKLCSK